MHANAGRLLALLLLGRAFLFGAPAFAQEEPEDERTTAPADGEEASADGTENEGSEDEGSEDEGSEDEASEGEGSEDEADDAEEGASSKIMSLEQIL